ncbi:hypothetical protein K438DRAFT_1954805 [Mycena galopus ATCC 62051]|nr:hypothetical protein K438DRAFT_1954805 [Mycena galopus ATCC 62051]
MSYTMLPEPRVHPEDASNAMKEPFQTWFAEVAQINARQQNKWLEEKASLLLVPPHDEWAAIINNWVHFCLAVGSLRQSEAASLFTKVLWCQSNINNNQVDEPLELLRKAQVDSLKKPIRLERCIPRKINALDALVEDDVSYSEAEDSDSDDNSDLAFDLHFGWRSPENSERYPDMGSVIQQMKAVRRSIYNRDNFRDLVSSLGLQLIFETLCDETCASEVDPHLAESYRLYNWRNQLNLVWNDWSPQEIYTGKEWQKMPGEILNTGGKGLTINFLKALADNVWMIPRGTSPALAVFFLASLPNFLQAWELWLRGSLLRAAIKIDDWSPEKLYRGLAATKAVKWSEMLRARNITCPPELQLLLDLNEELRNHIKTVRDKARNPSVVPGEKGIDQKKQFNARRKAEAGESVSSPAPERLDPTQFVRFEDNQAAWGRLHKDCPTCKNFVNPDDRCVRIWHVDRRPEVRKWKGCVISSAPENDRLEPKDWSVHGANEADSTTWFKPEDLSLRVLSARDAPHILSGCKRDITLLVDNASQKQVGSVFFGAIQDPLLESLKKSNYSVLHETSLTRSADQQKWVYGSMVAIGSRIPKGGIRGDSYRAYDHVKAEDPSDKKLLFEHAKAAETIAAVIEVMDPDAAKALRPDIGLHPLGSTCCNLYRCHDYMSCGHWDRDGVKPLKQEPAARKLKKGCAQYHNNCLPDEFNFVYTEWGVLVKTVPGCVWVFNSDDMHQVTLPRRSSVNKAGGEPMCSGDHPTVTSANAAKAQAFERARRLRAVTADYWKHRGNK